MANPGSTLGCDYAGVVEEVGSKVTKSWQKGDRIAGFVHGGNASQPEDGGFAEYVKDIGCHLMEVIHTYNFCAGTVLRKATFK